MLDFVFSFFDWAKTIFLFAYNTFVFRITYLGQVYEIKFLDCLFAILIIFIVISVFWRSGKW